MSFSSSNTMGASTTDYDGLNIMAENVSIMGRVVINKQVDYISGYQLDVSGNASANSWPTTSDYRIKENIREIEESIDQLRPVTYFNELTQGQDIGFIAHELQECIPFMVHGNKDDDNYQTINYNCLIALLVKEIQSLKREIEKLESKANETK